MSPLVFDGRQFIGKELWYTECPTKPYHPIPGVCIGVGDGVYIVSTEEGVKEIYFSNACNHDPNIPRNISMFESLKIVDS